MTTSFQISWADPKKKYDKDKGEFVEYPVIEVGAGDTDDLEEVVRTIELLEDWTAEEIEQALEEYA